MAVARVAPCIRSSQEAAIPCFMCLSDHEIEVIKLWMLYKLYEAKGGTLPTIDQLKTYITCFECFSDKEISAMELAAIQSAAGQSGATLDGTDVRDITVAQIKEEIPCWFCEDPKIVRVAMMYGLCQTLDLITESQV